MTRWDFDLAGGVKWIDVLTPTADVLPTDDAAYLVVPPAKRLLRHAFPNAAKPLIASTVWRIARAKASRPSVASRPARWGRSEV